MKHIRIPALTLLVYPVLAAAPSPEEAAARLAEGFHYFSSADIKKAIAPDRDGTVAVLREMARNQITIVRPVSGAPLRANNFGARVILLKLPDVETLDSFGKQFGGVEPDGPWGVLGGGGLTPEALASKQPRLVSYFRESLFASKDGAEPDVVLAGEPHIRSEYALRRMMDLAGC